MNERIYPMSVFSQEAYTLMMEDRLDEAQNMLLAEDVEDKLLKAIGEVNYVNYLMKFEQYLDDHDIYAFDKWEDAEIIATPKVDRFWVTIWMKLQPGTDMRGAKRLLNDKENQNEISYREEPDETVLMKFKILRRLLDKIEIENKENADEIADREAGQIGV
jgi:hypothetical protein